MTPTAVDIRTAVDRTTRKPTKSTSPKKANVANNDKPRKKSRKKKDATKNASTGSKSAPVSNMRSTQPVDKSTQQIANSTRSAKKTRELVWAKAGKTADGNSFSLKRIRNGDTRTLIVGSLRGYDPPAIAIMDQLAENLEYNASIMGGVDCLLLRTANPDGLAHRAVTTSAGLELKNAFPIADGFKLNSESPQTEVRFLVRLLKQFQPDRVVLIGQSESVSGGVVYSSNAKEAARNFADSVELADYPLDVREQAGSLERFVVECGAEVISVQLPNSTTVESGWPRFGVWLPALFSDSRSRVSPKHD